MRFFLSVPFFLLLLIPPSQAVFDEDGWPVQQQHSVAQSQVKQVSTAEYEQFKRGNTIFDCEVSCAFVYDGAVLKFLYGSEDWEALARKTLEYGMLEDESYFFLAKAAEGLGHLDAARKYYKRSIAATRADMSCGGFLETCEGFDFPHDAKVALAELERESIAPPPQQSYYPSVRTKTMSKPAVVTPSSKRFAVVIGISRYQDSNVVPLKYAARDAKAFYNWLTQNGGYEESNVKLLLNEDATLKNIRQVLFQWLGNTIEEDLVTIYFAGHGSPDSPDSQENLYLLPYDIEVNSIAATGFPMWDVKEALKRSINANKVVIIADACHSGGIGSEFDIAYRALRINNKREAELNPIGSGLQELSKVNDGVAVISASGRGELSREGQRWGGGHGVFTYHLLQGLMGKADYNEDDSVAIGEITSYVSEYVRRDTKNAQHPLVSGQYDPSMAVGGPVQKDSTLQLEDMDLNLIEADSKSVSSSSNDGLHAEMVTVQGGCFQMGSPVSEIGRFHDEHQHRVCVDDFRIGAFEVTNSEYRRYKPSHNMKGDGNNPVTNISWRDANNYIDWLNLKTDKSYRLPTEAEWEYTARAGTATSRYWGDDPDYGCKFGNVADQSVARESRKLTLHGCVDGSSGIAIVGQYKPNHLWVYDLLGNVWEWTCSSYDENYEGGEQKCSDKNRLYGMKVLRGGGWLSGPRNVRSANRHFHGADRESRYFGFRLAESK